MSRDVVVMTMICDHYKERGLRCPFWDRYLSSFAHVRPMALLFLGTDNGCSYEKHKLYANYSNRAISSRSMTCAPKSWRSFPVCGLVVHWCMAGVFLWQLRFSS